MGPSFRVVGSILTESQRRTTKYTPPAPAQSKAAPKIAAKPRQAVPSDTKAPPAKKESGSEAATSGRSTPQPPSMPSNLKKTDSKSNLKKDRNDIFKAFGKAKQAPKEAKAEPPPAKEEDGELPHCANGVQLTDIVVTMQGMSEDEGEDDEGPEVKFDEEKAAQLRKARADREADLKRMMEESGKLLTRGFSNWDLM